MLWVLSFGWRRVLRLTECMEGKEGSGVPDPGEYARWGSRCARTPIGSRVPCLLFLTVGNTSFCPIRTRAARAVEAGVSAAIPEEFVRPRADLCYMSQLVACGAKESNWVHYAFSLCMAKLTAAVTPQVGGPSVPGVIGFGKHCGLPRLLKWCPGPSASLFCFAHALASENLSLLLV